MSTSELEREVARRRTFAIISHPDAGKTTLTEKLLLYGGAIHLAGSVKARRARRHATSDWMELEKERGISVTSSVLQFPYRGHAHRRGQGRRAADQEALPSVSAAEDPHLHVREQARPPRACAARSHG